MIFVDAEQVLRVATNKHKTKPALLFFLMHFNAGKKVKNTLFRKSFVFWSISQTFSELDYE